jgi:uncharacterized protein (DUF2342 family)
MNPESTSRALNAVDDLVRLLQLAEGAAQRLTQEVHGPSFDHAELIARDLQRLRRSADTLHDAIDQFVGVETAT